MTSRTDAVSTHRPDWRVEGIRLLPSILLATVGAAYEPVMGAVGVVPILVFIYCILTGRLGRS